MQRFTRTSWLAMTFAIGLGFYGLGLSGVGHSPPAAAQAQQPSVEQALPDAPAAIINQLREMNGQLKEINSQMKEQNKLLSSGKLKVNVFGPGK